MLYLAYCAVNEIKPDLSKISEIDMEELYNISQFHNITSMICMALESGGIKVSQKWIESKYKAIRKNILLDTEREKIFEFMDKNGIWHMQLKGAILKDMYPRIGMRQMSDNDILYDSSFQQQLNEYMKQNGYTYEKAERTYPDVYMKPPVYNYEMHTSLFTYKNKFYDYYIDIKSKLIKDNNSPYEYNFTDEDFYIYITAHEYKHYSNNGTGIRSLLDCFVYIKEKKNLNWDYINGEFKKLGRQDFEYKTRILAEKIFKDFSIDKLSDDEKEMLKYYLYSGTYGTFNNSIKNRKQNMNADTKSKYILKRIFPDMEFYRIYYPFFYRHKILLPIGWTYRLIRALIFRRKKIINEMKVVENLMNSD